MVQPDKYYLMDDKYQFMFSHCKFTLPSFLITHALFVICVCQVFFFLTERTLLSILLKLLWEANFVICMYKVFKYFMCILDEQNFFSIFFYIYYCFIHSIFKMHFFSSFFKKTYKLQLIFEIWWTESLLFTILTYNNSFTILMYNILILDL